MNSTFYRILEIDQKVTTCFRSFSNPGIKFAFGLVTYLGSGAVWIPIYALLTIFYKGYFSGLVFNLIIAEVCGLPIIIVLRYVTRRERPVPHPRKHVLSPWNKYSFPSHHAMRSFMIAILVGMSYQSWLPFLIVTAVIISFSRLYLLRHYLSDVLTGALLGLFLAITIKVVCYYA